MASSEQVETKEEQLHTLHRVGEILQKSYRVKEICSDENGTASYKCERVNDGVEVLIDCLSLGNMVPPNSFSLFERSKNEMLNAKDPNKSPIHDSFELNTHSDIKFYVVRRATPQPHEASTQSLRGLKRSRIEPQLRQSPQGTPCVVYRKGDSYLEIDVPAEGFVCWSGIYLLLIPIAVPILGIVHLIWGAIKGNLLKVLISSLVAVVGYVALVALTTCFLARFIFGHNNLVITPTYFRNKMTLESKPGFKDSVDHPAEAVTKLTRMDGILCKQIRGRTGDIVKAALETYSVYEKPDKSLVLLMTNGNKHVLYFHLSHAQKHWIVEEINEVLTNIGHPT